MVLIYTYAGGSSGVPAQQDIKGQKVITGIHSSHSTWAYKRIPGYANNIPAHKHYCIT